MLSWHLWSVEYAKLAFHVLCSLLIKVIHFWTWNYWSWDTILHCKAILGRGQRGKWDEFRYESCPQRRIDHSTCWPMVPARYHCTTDAPISEHVQSYNNVYIKNTYLVWFVIIYCDSVHILSSSKQFLWHNTTVLTSRKTTVTLVTNFYYLNQM